jgi:oligopeptide/dipeptide ABC transporter ATP-binding protein
MSIAHLDIRFPARGRDLHVVDDLSLDLAEGEVLGLVGESGSGKSLTALAALGLVPPPGKVTGSVRVDGREVVGASPAALAAVRGRGAAMIFQNPGAALNPFFTIGGQLTEIVARQRRLAPAEARRVLVGAFEETHLADPSHALARYPHQLSGGQLQRVMIALALACKPKLLIADEPTTALDVTVQAQIVETLRQLAADQHLAILFITHDLGLVGALCHRVAVMYAGAIVEMNRVESFFAVPRHPYSERLLSAVPRLGAEGALATIPGQVPNPAARPEGCAFHPRCRFAQAICQSRKPALKTDAGGAAVACHFPLAVAS